MAVYVLQFIFGISTSWKILQGELHMGHSTVISEPLAIFLGVLMGAVGYATAAAFTPDHGTRLLVGGITSVATNLLIGGPINVVTLDILALLLVRPLSAYAGFKILEYGVTIFAS